MPRLEYVTANVAVRPARGLLLIPCHGDRWSERVRVAVEWFSQTWGGSGHALLPVIDGQVAPIFRPLVRAFDPDWICVWQSTVRGGYEADPAALQEWLRSMAQRMRMSVEAVAAQFERDGTLDEPVPWPAGQGAADGVAQWCAPHRMHGSSFVEPYGSAARTVKPLCDLEDISRNDVGDQVVVRLDCDDWAPDELRLGVDARFGRFSSAAAARLHSAGLRSIVLPSEPSDLEPFAESLLIGRHIAEWSLHQRWQAHLGLAATGEPPAAFSGSDLVTACPMSIAATGTVEATRGGSVPSAVVIGDDPQAFFVALLLDRLLQSATWLRTSSLDTDYGQAVVTAAARGLARSNRSPGLRELLVVDDFDIEGAKRFAARANLDNDHRRAPETRLSSISQLPLTSTNFLVDPELSRSIAVPAQIDHGLACAVPIDTLQPSTVSGRSADSLVWQVEVGFVGHDAPARSLLSTDDLTVDQGGLSDLRVRAGRHGLVFESHDLGIVMPGWGLSQMLARPRLRVPSVHEVFTRLHTKRGVNLRRSDAGDLTAGLLGLWPDLPAAAADVRGAVRRLLDGFSSEQARINHGLGYLHYPLCRELVGGDEEVARAAVDRFCEAGVLHRGFLLKCGRCGWRAFYRLDVVTTRSFECVRCGASTNLTRKAWTGGDEPWWFYDLDQLVRAALEKRNDVVLLALDALRSSSRQSFSWMHETALYRPAATKPFAEIDIMALCDARITIGEAKKSNHLSKSGREKAERDEVANYLKAVTRIDADRLVFATAAGEWSTAAMAAIEGAAGTGLEVLSLTQVGEDVQTRLISKQ